MNICFAVPIVPEYLFRLWYPNISMHMLGSVTGQIAVGAGDNVIVPDMRAVVPDPLDDSNDDEDIDNDEDLAYGRRRRRSHDWPHL